MSPEQVSNIISAVESICLVGIGALGGVISAKITAKNNLETVVLKHEHVRREASIERDMQIYKQLLMDIDNIEYKINEIAECVIEMITFFENEPNITNSIEEKIKYLKNYDSTINELIQGDLLASIKSLTEMKEKIAQNKIDFTQRKKEAFKSFNSASSEMITTVYLTGNNRIINQTKLYTDAVSEIFSAYTDEKLTTDDIKKINFAKLHYNKNVLKVAVSEEFRKIL